MDLGTALYEDRRLGRSVPVLLRGEGGFLLLLREDGRELDRWPAAAVRPVPDAGADGHARLGLAADSPALLALPCPEVPPALAGFLAGQGRSPALKAHKAKRDLPLPVWLGGAAASVVLLLFVVLPALGDVLAGFVPPSLERRIGEQVAEVATGILVKGGRKAECRTPEGTAALDRLVQRIRLPDGPAVQVRVIDSDMVNAFAAPGGFIVVPVGMVRFAGTPEALLGVLAHEVGHVAEGHAMRRVMRVAMSSTLLTLLTGDLGGGIGAAAVGQMVESGYSQEHEREADAYAVAALRAAGLPTDPFADLFGRMQLKVGDQPKWLALVASHPDIQSRIAAIRGGDGPAAGSGPDLSADWAALQAICGPPPPETEAGKE
ncbi:M48 family metallopeptidase [Aerophototrophica crusticola]|uniref:M48 family metallopeptidase n=1 Tax=Aerophototrophica crusticola TaxID=1709002 RepID=A0A858RAI3_9PROT|nr:M48 family metallopeptidase [Rhodospirillaceae bacterium B3]